MFMIISGKHVFYSNTVCIYVNVNQNIFQYFRSWWLEWVIRVCCNEWNWQKRKQQGQQITLRLDKVKWTSLTQNLVDNKYVK